VTVATATGRRPATAPVPVSGLDRRSGRWAGSRTGREWEEHRLRLPDPLPPGRPCCGWTSRPSGPRNVWPGRLPTRATSVSWSIESGLQSPFPAPPEDRPERQPHPRGRAHVQRARERRALDRRPPRQWGDDRRLRRRRRQPGRNGGRGARGRGPPSRARRAPGAARRRAAAAPPSSPPSRRGSPTPSATATSSRWTRTSRTIRGTCPSSSKARHLRHGHRLALHRGWRHFGLGPLRPLLSWLANKYIRPGGGHPHTRHDQRLPGLSPRGAGGGRLRSHQDHGLRGPRRDGLSGLAQRVPPGRGAHPLPQPAPRRLQAHGGGDLHGAPELRPPATPLREGAAAPGGSRAETS
jgi:hypothetical protein